jgi:hypothetical protein
LLSLFSGIVQEYQSPQIVGGAMPRSQTNRGGKSSPNGLFLRRIDVAHHRLHGITKDEQPRNVFERLSHHVYPLRADGRHLEEHPLLARRRRPPHQEHDVAQQLDVRFHVAFREPVAARGQSAIDRVRLGVHPMSVRVHGRQSVGHERGTDPGLVEYETRGGHNADTHGFLLGLGFVEFSGHVRQIHGE